jgi:hypothetical protein
MSASARESQHRCVARHASRARRSSWLAAIIACLALPAAAEIYKCTAAGGRVTYQQSPCPAGSTGGRPDLAVDNGSSRAGSKEERDWEDAVKSKGVIIGMPRTYVVRALGQPPDIRNGTPAADNATEVWSYPQGTDTLRIGMTGGVVTWQKIDTSAAGPAGAVTSSSRQIELRRAVVPGVSCAQTIADLGPPDVDETDKTLVHPYRHLTWGATQEDPKGTMFVTCLEGLVTEARREVQP